MAEIVDPESVVCDAHGFGVALRDKKIKELRYSLVAA